MLFYVTQIRLFLSSLKTQDPSSQTLQSLYSFAEDSLHQKLKAYTEYRPREACVDTTCESVYSSDLPVLSVNASALKCWTILFALRDSICRSLMLDQNQLKKLYTDISTKF